MSMGDPQMPMTSEQAILAIRHVVQDHGDEGTRLGDAALCDGIRWFGSLLGWAWPTSYLEVIGKHDGVMVRDAWVFSFLESVERFLFLHERWHRPDGFWPVASDGCGNYFALSLGRTHPLGESPVVFFDMIESPEEPVELVAENYAAFIVGHMRRQCECLGCRVLSSPSTASEDETVR
jgi:hypothetical protein